jgi:hypothetical protein
LSDKFVDNGTELLFTQFLAKKKLPNNILYYHEANPNIIQDIHNNTVVNYDNIYDNRLPVNAEKDKSKSKVSDIIINMPLMFDGDPKDLNSKWTKYKKKIWWQLKYIKNDYAVNNIIDLFNYFKLLDNDIVNDYNDIIKKTFKYYMFEFNKDLPDTKKIKEIFKDPHFYSTYISAMNQVNSTKKTFKTLEIFLTTYFNSSPIPDRARILKQISDSPTFVYHPNEITFFHISKVLNISILIIHNRAEYGKALLVKLSADLGQRHGRGFSRSNLTYMRLLYQRYPISEKPSHLFFHPRIASHQCE